VLKHKRSNDIYHDYMLFMVYNAHEEVISAASKAVKVYQSKFIKHISKRFDSKTFSDQHLGGVYLGDYDYSINDHKSSFNILQ